VLVVTRQITYVTLADGRRQERKLPLIFRLLLPLAPNLTPLFRRPAFVRTARATERRLTSAGFEGLLSAEEFMALKVLIPLILGLLIWVPLIDLAVRASQMTFFARMKMSLWVLGLMWFYMYPILWLRRAVAIRHQNIRRALPFVLDLLTLSVEAGMDFMTSLQRNIEKRAIDPLGEELIRVVREIQVGKTRSEALRDMSYRVNLSDLRSVVNALVQADELGVSIGSILRIQSDQIRQRRFERAEKLANEAPVKMLFPLMFFIFPAVFLILLGPVIAKMMKTIF
jgi:tight adherence protein C